MDAMYGDYCLADPVFYDRPTQAPSEGDFSPAERAPPEGWIRAELGDSIACRPEDARLPAQGWKIHASASLDDAEELLADVWDYCVPRGIAFKFVRSERLLLIRNAKYAARESSGKFVTIYPEDEPQLQAVLRELGAILDGRQGPYILSDLRWGEGPLYVRYGAFAARHCMGENGELVPAVEDQGGRLVPDRRGATFDVPGWVSLPGYLEPHLSARGAATVAELPYRIEGALHFSNAGGLYLGVDRESGERVVLKEARPLAGLSADRADAPARLDRERSIMERLHGLDFVPDVRDDVRLGGHHFLVRDFIEGVTLWAALVDRYPLTVEKTDEAALAGYASWAMEVCGLVESAVAAVHDRGVVIGDLQPSNVLVRPDGRVALIDFEAAAHVREARRPAVAAPGFMAPRDRTGFDIDRYALGCLRLSLFLPLTSLIALDPAKAKQLADQIAELFPVPREYLAAAVDTINPRKKTTAPVVEPGPDGRRRACASMAQAILASATPRREDRLFPGDVAQFTS